METQRRQEPGQALVCDIAAANAFSAQYNQPPLPVLTAFGNAELHQWRRAGSFQLDRAAEKERGALIRSYHNQSTDGSVGRWCELLFQFGPKAFIHANDRRIVGYGLSPSEAERQVVEFSKNLPN